MCWLGVPSNSFIAGSDADAPIPLPNVSGRILEKIIAYCKYHHDHPTPASDDKKDERRTDDIIPWDKEFCSVDQPTLFELILVRWIYYLGGALNSHIQMLGR